MRQPYASNKADPFLAEERRRNDLLCAVSTAAEMLITADLKDFDMTLRSAMELMASCVEVDRVYIWQNQMRDGSFQYVQRLEWVGNGPVIGVEVASGASFPYADSLPSWEGLFMRGECINGPLSSFSQAEQDCLGPYGVKSMLVIPVHLKDIFWGFISFDDCQRERTFSEEETVILRAGILMLASAMERHDSDQRIKEMREHAQLMLDATPLCCSLWSSDYKIIDTNEEALKFYGLTDKQEYIKRFFDLSPQYQPDGRESRGAALSHIAKAFAEGRLVIPWMHQLVDGSPIPAEVTLVRVRRGNELIVAGYTRDLREEQKMVQQIEHKDMLLRAVNHAASILHQSDMDVLERSMGECLGMLAHAAGVDVIRICKNFERNGELYYSQQYSWPHDEERREGGERDASYRVSAPGWEETLSRGECINDLASNLPQPKRVPLLARGVLSVLVVPVFLNERFWGFVAFEDCKTGRVFSPDDESILLSGSFLIANALLRNQMAGDIRSAVEEARAASNAKSVFLAHMSHEIRTPMNVISGMTKMILREELSPTVYERMMNIKQATTNMLSLVNDILDFSKIEAGTMDIVMNEYSLTSLINNVLVAVRMRLAEKPLLFTANIDSNIPNRLIGDETRVRQILLNVLENAAKYTNEGYISLEVNGRTWGEEVILEAKIRDTGVGIKEEDLARLFDEFIRFDSQKNRSIQGSGLGLAIASRLCAAMGGGIEAESEYGVGSTFTITLPQRVKSYSERFASVYEPECKDVLLYEMRSIYAESIMRSLENLGVRVVLVGNLDEFEKEIVNGDYSFVFVSSILAKRARKVMKEKDSPASLALLMDSGETPSLRNVRTLAMPVHAATIANVLDDIEDNFFAPDCVTENQHFVAPTARVLAVDDLVTNLKVVDGLMEPYRMKVDLCESGEEALELLRKNRYDLIFMDHMMPGMDGIEATARIRALPSADGYFQTVPIVALTANAISGVKEMFLQNGMDDFLAKPIDVTRLHNILEKWIPADKVEKFHKVRALRLTVKHDPAPISIGGVDVASGIELAAGSLKSYMKTLAAFYADGIGKKEKILDYLVTRDLQLYTIAVHALKGASASIGAGELSERFKALETAAGKKDEKYILKHTGPTLDELDKLLSEIKRFLGSRNDRRKTEDDGSVGRELRRLKRALEDHDAALVDEILFALHGVELREDQEQRFKELEQKILLMGYSEALGIVESLLQP